MFDSLTIAAIVVISLVAYVVSRAYRKCKYC
jgi:hypothetical protein